MRYLETLEWQKGCGFFSYRIYNKIRDGLYDMKYVVGEGEDSAR